MPRSYVTGMPTACWQYDGEMQTGQMQTG